MDYQLFLHHQDIVHVDLKQMMKIHYHHHQERPVLVDGYQQILEIIQMVMILLLHEEVHSQEQSHPFRLLRQQMKVVRIIHPQENLLL